MSVVSARTTGPEAGPLTIEATAKEIEALGGEALAIPCDVTQETEVEDMVRQTIREWGRVDVLTLVCAANGSTEPRACLLRLARRPNQLAVVLRLDGGGERTVGVFDGL